ncbi:diacylglycerol kinase 5-like isoform X1 [Rosa rugosa]|uniref:diacylglycerol kinase 5-like isoform X1 n=1 Tax=Rosa rugosa TaxID=74645 RepID=UPI002B4122C1|nr:diacylglycerol kinase 5-like isoform X1 [Rosa rugosa]
MASEVARFLQNSFVDSLDEAESELSGSALISYFKAIKDVVKAKEITTDPDRYSETIRVLHKLNDALSEYRIFELECKDLNKKLLLFNPFTYYFIRKMKKQLKTIRQELESAAAAREGIDNRFDLQEKSQSIHSSNIFGFVEEAKHIEGLLFSCATFTAIAIAGIAGVGKTTLVQKVLERKKVIDGFKSIFWLSFSGMKGEQEQYNRLSVETCIVDNLGHTIEGKIVGLSELLEKLNQHLSGKRYLLVLDDMWRQHIDIGKRLQRGLPKGSGGAVIFTTRLNEVAEKLVEQDKLIHVQPLDGQSCWLIFHETMKNNGENLYASQLYTLNKIEGEIKDQCHGLPSVAKTLAKIIPEQIREIESERFLMDLYIPDELLRTDLDAEPAVYIPKCPVLVFIDMKNEQLGRLLIEFRYRLNKEQVYAVLEQGVEEKNPEAVLREVYATLGKLKQKNYSFASKIENEMRIVIVGGDAVVNWILGIICDLKLPEAPSIVPIPQGTENDIPVTFGWKELKADRQSVTTFLNEEVTVAEKMKTDSWHILIKMKPTPSSTPQQEIPPSLHVFRRVSEGVTQITDNLTLCGGVWNYFSLGVDAPRSYAPYCFHPNARTLNSLAKVWIIKDGKWELLSIPSRIKSIICLNLPTYLGEPSPWGTPNMKKDRERLLKPSFIDDGHLEIIGLTDVLLAQNEHIRLGQVRGIRFEFIKDAAESVNMKIDGAPWKKIPLEGIIEIEMSYHGQVNILANGDCPAKRSNHNSSQPRASGVEDDNAPCASQTDDDTNAKDNSEAYKKFTATRTFKIS